jgi:hypothetical protein
MREIDLDELTFDDLVDGDMLIAAFIGYLKETLDYTDDEAKMAATDMEDPYNAPYVMQDYEGIYEVDGVDYEVRSCYTDFCACGLFHLAGVEPFEFYMLFNAEDIEDESVSSYMNARKMFIV